MSRLLRNSRAGFTLLEAVIAMALMVTIITLLGMISGQWLPNWNRGFTRVQTSELLASGLERIVGDLAASQFISRGRETRYPLFEGAPRSVIFVRETLLPAPVPTLEIVRIAETTGRGGLVVTRMRAAFTPVVNGPGRRDEPEFADPVVLLHPPYRLTFSYAGADRIWHDAWHQQLELPKAIKLTVSEASTRRTLAVSTATLVHAEVPVECLSAKSFTECQRSRAQGSDDGNPREKTSGQTQ